MDINDSLKFLQERFNYIDTITIVDNTGRVMVQLRYNPRFSKEENEKENRFAINKNILEVITSITPETSTLIRVLNTGKIVFSEEQTMWDHEGRKLVCTNINFPIISRGKIIGAIELSKDITHIEKRNRAFRHYSIPIIRQTEGNSTNYSLEDIVTADENMLKLKDQIKRVSNSSSSVLIYGETGTGKELFIQAIHNEGHRRYRPFVAMNCAALPENLLESILFGSVKGAFTGSVDQKGLFEQAHGGTIYLDEINSMPVNLQAKLLRAIQDRYIMRLGNSVPVKVDVRVIASINRDAKEVLEKGLIREDLFYRLSVINIKIPPLRKRYHDVPVLTEHFIRKFNNVLNKKVTGISAEVRKLFLSYEWPGNVRELEHVIEGAMNVVDGETIKLEHLPVYLSEGENSSGTGITPLINVSPLKDAVEQVERSMIYAAMLKAGGNVSKASKFLQMPRTTLQYKLEKYKLDKIKIAD